MQRIPVKKEREPTALRKLKRLAKKEKKARGIPYTEALEVVAEAWGYLDYQEARSLILGEAYARELAAANADEGE